MGLSASVNSQGLRAMTERVRKIEGTPSAHAAKIVLAYAERKDRASL